MVTNKLTTEQAFEMSRKDVANDAKTGTLQSIIHYDNYYEKLCDENEYSDEIRYAFRHGVSFGYFESI